MQFRTDYRRILQGEKEAPEISSRIARLKNKKMLQPEKESSRKYVIRFDNNYLLRHHKIFG